MGRRAIENAVRVGTLIRVRRGHYAVFDALPEVVEAIRLGGRLDCVSLLRALGVFTHHPPGLHVQFSPHAGRLPPRGTEVTAHWRAEPGAFHEPVVDLVGALVQAVRCQDPRSAVATLDSAWHLGLIDEAMLSDVFRRLPSRYLPLRRLLDRRSESGPETLVRLLLRSIGCRFELQVLIRGVGRVDLLVDGWLIVECDSKAFHSSWDAQRADRRRDLAAAASGYVTLRVLAEDVLYRSDDVRAALRGAVGCRRARAQIR